MKRFLLIILIAVVATTAFAVVKYKEVLVMAASDETIEEVQAEEAVGEQKLIDELKEVGININNLGDMPTIIENPTATNNAYSNSAIQNQGNSSASNAAQTDGKKAESVISSKGSIGIANDRQGQSQSAIISAYYNEFINYKVGYEGKINQLFNSAKAEYTSLPEEQKTRDNLVKIGFKYIGKVSEIEKAADSEINDILFRFEKDLKSNQYDTLIVDEIRSYYSKYKSSQKAYYISRLKGN